MCLAEFSSVVNTFAVASAVVVTAEFEFPLSVAEEFKLEEMIFIGTVGGGFESGTSDLPATVR